MALKEKYEKFAQGMVIHNNATEAARFAGYTANSSHALANTGFRLHIIEPIGFPLDDKSLKRAKLDYFSNINPIIYKNYKSFMDAIDEKKIYYS